MRNLEKEDECGFFLIVRSSELPFIMYPLATGAESLDVFVFFNLKPI